jgi:hypothetical protein
MYIDSLISSIPKQLIVCGLGGELWNWRDSLFKAFNCSHCVLCETTFNKLNF